jgi:hypothetical protein
LEPHSNATADEDAPESQQQGRKNHDKTIPLKKNA